MQNKLAYVLMAKLLEMIGESGANKVEAECALRAALAMVPELDLEPKTTKQVWT